MRKLTLVTILLIMLTMIGTLPWYFLAPEAIGGIIILVLFTASTAVAIFSAIQLHKSHDTGVGAITCSLFCLVLGNLYLLLHYLIRGFFAKSIFTISDFAYVGSYLFIAAFILWLFFQHPPARQHSMKICLIAIAISVAVAAGHVISALMGRTDTFSSVVFGVAAILVLSFGTLLLMRLQRMKPFIYLLIILAVETGLNIILELLDPYTITFATVLVQVIMTCLFICYIPVIVAFREESDRRADDETKPAEQEVHTP